MTKLHKIENLFHLTLNKADYYTAIKPALAQQFEHVSFADEQIRQQAFDLTFERFFAELQHAYVTAYDTHYDESEIDRLVAFFESETGQKYTDKNNVITREISQAYATLAPIVQEVIAELAPETIHHAQSEDVINFSTFFKTTGSTDQLESFNQLISHKGLSAVKFSATWCPPCKAYSPHFEKAAEQKDILKDTTNIPVTYAEVDIDTFQKIAQQYRVTSIPTTVFFKDGVPATSITGILSAQELLQKLHEIA